MVEIFDDIRKLYRFSDPCEQLSAYIEFFSETSLEATDLYIRTDRFTVKLFPSYTPTIWINLGSPYHLKNGNKELFVGADTDILILRDDIVERTNLRTDNIFTVKFNPGGFEAIFGIEQEKIGNNIININSILFSHILGRLKQLSSFEERKALLEKHFLHLLNTKFVHNHLYKKVSDAIHTYRLSDMTYSSNELAEELAVTDKTLYRYFRNLVGAPPKKYFLTVRARAALISYVADKKSFSPFDFGYYDISHFHKDVVKFTGRKLSAWLS
jgi:AraC-like DNA-binding protein